MVGKIGSIALAAIVTAAVVGSAYVGLTKGYEQGRKAATPIFRDFTGDGRNDIAFRNQDGGLTCLVAEGAGNYVQLTTHRPKDSQTWYCNVNPRIGYLNPLTGRKL